MIGREPRSRSVSLETTVLTYFLLAQEQDDLQDLILIFLFSRKYEMDDMLEVSPNTSNLLGGKQSEAKSKPAIPTDRGHAHTQNCSTTWHTPALAKHSHSTTLAK